MLQAVNQGKVPSSVRCQEDVLTSCVFGTLDLLPASLGLTPWLRNARNLDGAALEVEDALLDQRQPRFWPRYPLGQGESVEPDLVLDCGDLVLVIEAKYGAGPSGMPIQDEERIGGQLGRQWLATRAAAPARSHRLIYVTADWSMPRADMDAMVRETEAKFEGAGMRAGLYWMSWRTLVAALPTVVAVPGHARAVDAVRTLLRTQGLDMFRGVEIPAAVSRPLWSYGYGSPHPVSINWTYERSEAG